MRLFEKYRPRNLGDVVGQPKAVDAVADPFFVTEIVADQVGADVLNEWERTMRMTSWGKGGRAFIINEAHGLRAGIQRRLLQLLEEDLPGHVVFVFTTTWDGQDSMFDGIDGTPLLSRCMDIRLTNQGLAKAFAANVRRIAAAEGLDVAPDAEYVKLANKHRSNHRSMLQAIEIGEIGSAS